jgi:phosphoribosylformylglycinamidine (FGAM) synthase-like enzyme
MMIDMPVDALLGFNPAINRPSFVREAQLQEWELEYESMTIEQRATYNAYMRVKNSVEWLPVVTLTDRGVHSKLFKVKPEYTRYQLMVTAAKKIVVKIKGKDGTVPYYFPAGKKMKQIMYLPPWKFRITAFCKDTFKVVLRVWNSTEW